MYLSAAAPAALDDKKDLRRQIMIYTLLFAVTAAGVYLAFLVCGRTFITEGDGKTQQYPFYVMVKRMIAGLIDGDGFQFWRWEIGLGADGFVTFVGKLMNPLTYITIAFPEKYIDVGYSLMVVVTQYLAGLSFLLFGREVSLGRYQQIVGGLSYAFCGWLIFVSTQQGMLDIGPAVLPLLMLGTEKILKGKSPLLFILSVAYMLLCNFLLSYIAAILVILFFAVRYFRICSGRSAMDFIKKAAAFAGYGITGMLIGGIGLVFNVFKMSGANTSATVETPLLYTLEGYFKIPSGLFSLQQTVDTYYSQMYIPVICIILLPLIVKNIRKSTPALLSVVLFAAALLPVTGRIFNGFSYSTPRWYYGEIFFVVWAAMELLKSETFRPRKTLKMLAVWILALGVWNIGVCHFVLDILTKDAAGACIVGLGFGLLIIALYYIRGYRLPDRKLHGISYKRIMDMVIVVILIGSIIGTANMKFYPGVSDYLFEESKPGEVYGKLQKSTQRVVQKLQDEDGSFFRTDQVDGMSDTRGVRVKTNEGIYFGNRSIQTYISTMSSMWHKFNRTMGNNAGYFDRTTSYSNDNRAGLDLLTGVKYFLGDDAAKVPGASEYAPYGFTKTGSIDGIDILENKYSIGLGSLYSQYITESELKKYPYLEREQVMLQAAVVPDDQAGKIKGVKHAGKDDLKTDVREIDYDISDVRDIDMDKEGSMTVHNNDGSIIIDLPEIKNAQIVVSFDNLVREKSGYKYNLELNDGEPRGGRLRKFLKEVSYDEDEKFDITVYKGGYKTFDNDEKDKKKAQYRKNARNRKGKYQGFGDVTDFNINFGYYDSISGKIRIDINRSGDYTFDSLKIYAVPMDIYDESASELQENSLDVTSFENDKIDATAEAKQDSVMYLSILDDPGWSIYVDGEKVEKTNDVNIAFTGAEIKKGTHDIELRYSPGRLYLGIGMTAVGIVIAAVICIIRKKRRPC